MSELKYRPEIDGLRTVAVVPVVLFHAGLGFRGGFVGVDVFFVISGFLITSMILREGEAFSLVAFWERRVRRILPAAAVMVLACLVAGWCLLFPLDFARLGRSMIAQSLLVSNVFFWRDLNYFATDEVRPLLHTWSLAVEEQFYFCLPFVLYALRRSSRQLIVWLFAATVLVSFAASVHGVRAHPSATFYLLPARAWELLLGALVAALPQLKFESRGVNEALSGSGLLAILLAATYYQADTPFPGEAALLPCVGTAAVIIGSSASPTLVRSVLSSRPFVWLGRISYSLYLWHWPLLAFAHYQRRSLSTVDSCVLVTLSLLTAWSSWRFIERPVRARVIFAERRPLFLAAALTMAGFLAIGVGIVKAKGVASRWSPGVLRYAEGKLDADFRVELDLQSVRRGDLIQLGIQDAHQPIALLVWGDSHAMAILHVVDVVCRERGLRCLAATHSSTAPLLDFPETGIFSLRQDAVPFGRAVLDFVRTHGVKRVLLAATWARPAAASPSELRSSLLRTVGALREAGAQVFVLKDVPRPGFDVPLVLAHVAAAGDDVNKVGTALAEHQEMNARPNAIIDGLPEGEAVVLDPTRLLCDQSALCRVARSGHPLYFDEHHLSTYGAMQVRPLFEGLFAKPPPGQQGD